MKFNIELLNDYRRLIQTTNLQESYQEFIALFRYIRVEMEKQLPEYKFQGNIAENSMDYSYFQFTNDELKKKGLKIAVVFVHRDFQFEIWLSGFNRSIQCQYCKIWSNAIVPFELTDNPKKQDYILRIPCRDNLDLADGSCVVLELKKTIFNLLEFLNQGGI